MPLDVYDNKEMDSRAPKDWMIVKKPEVAKMSSGLKLNDTNSDEPSTEKKASKPRITKTEIPAQGLW